MQQDLKIQTISQLSNEGNFITNLQITAPLIENGSKRNNVAIICVLDISGSMDSQATQGQSKQSDGFSRLDLVKHSVNTIIHTLQQNDILGVVTFSDKARVDFPLCKMNKDGKQKALIMINNMRTQGSTNLWDGIKNGLILSKDQQCEDKNTFVVVLSDGQPNSHPPGGELKACEDFIKQHPLTCNLSMFGYGYQLNTKLLTAITQLGGGCYGYIPDCSMVGTIFVNFLSHSLASYNALMTVEVQIKGDGKFISLNGKNSQKVLLGSAQFGSTRNCLIQFSQVKDGSQVCEITIRYGKNLRCEKNIKISASDLNKNSQTLKIQTLRYKYINFLHSAIQNAINNNIKVAKQQQLNLVAQMQQQNKQFQKNNQYLTSLIHDMQSPTDSQGQVGKALQNIQWWRKWGKHYLPALRIAHNIQMCTNFKDPGIQSYASDLFRQNQSKIDTIFIKLPPPSPTIKKYDAQGNVHQVQNMNNYYNRCGGCIHGDCKVELQNGQYKQIKLLQKNDIVKTHIGYSKIKCIIITQVHQTIQMVQFPSGLIITNYHPVIHNNQWKFPIDIKQSSLIYIDRYYNFVLEQGHSLKVNDVYCVTLGHNIKQNYVIQHEYLGTQQIIKDLSTIQGWNQGKIVIQGFMMQRDPITNKINGVNNKKEIQL